MPGEFPMMFETDNDWIRGLSFNDDLPTNTFKPGAGTRGPSSLLREVDGRSCGLPYGTIIYKNTCQRLLTQGLCVEGQWLVKKDNSDVTGECVPRPCPQGQLQYEGTCVDASDTTVCNKDQMLYVDLTGHVHCDCEPDFFYDPWRGHCFTQHDRGSCNFGEHLEINEGGAVECVPNPCLMEGYLKENSTGQCYKKMYRGSCEDVDHTLIFHHSNKTAECIVHKTHSIFDLPTLKSCPQGSRRFFGGTCRELFRVPAEITYRTTSYAHCDFGFTKDRRGTCRRTHKLFGWGIRELNKTNYLWNRQPLISVSYEWNDIFKDIIFQIASLIQF